MSKVVRIVASMDNYDRVVLFDAEVIRSGYVKVRLWHLAYQTFEPGIKGVGDAYSYTSSGIEYFNMGSDYAARTAFMSRVSSANPKLVSGMGRSLEHFLVKIPGAVEEENTLDSDLSGIQYVSMSPREAAWSPCDTRQEYDHINRRKSLWEACKGTVSSFLKTFLSR